MTLLPVSNPQPGPRETVFSYISRVAETWHSDVADLAKDIGIPFKRFLDYDPEAFRALAVWAGLSPDQLEEMLSWTGIRAGNVRMLFRGELCGSRALRNPVVRGCPICLREDALSDDGSSAACMVIRGDWQLREANVCVRHHHPLVRLWKAEKPRDRYDIRARVCEIEAGITSGAFDEMPVQPSAYDLWLDRRLQDGRDDTWLENHSIFVATTFCRLLGDALLANEGSDAACFVGASHAAGFNLARDGETSIREGLDRIAGAATGHLDEPNKVFGTMYSDLARNYADEGGFAPFREVLRECILDHWPIAAGENLLGKPVVERRMHSLVTAAKEVGVGPQVIEHFLVEVEAVCRQDKRPASRKVFDAQIHVELLKDIPSLVGPEAMRLAMGATRRELAALKKDGILRPKTFAPQVKKPWRISDGAALVAELSAMSFSVPGEDAKWETLLLARNRTQLSLSVLLEAIREGRVTLGHREGVPGYHGLVVPKRETNNLKSVLSTQKRDRKSELPGLMSAAEFGRLVGLRDGGDFIALVEAGHTPAFKCVNQRTGRFQYRVDAGEIYAFHSRFATLPILERETGQHRNTLRSLLFKAGVHRFSPKGQSFGPVYLRADVESAIG